MRPNLRCLLKHRRLGSRDYEVLAGVYLSRGTLGTEVAEPVFRHKSREITTNRDNDHSLNVRSSLQTQECFFAYKDGQVCRIC
jgi:hypothetical protein